MRMLFLSMAVTAAACAQALTAVWDLSSAGGGTQTTNGGTLYTNIWGKTQKEGTFALKVTYSMSSMTGTTALAIGPQASLPTAYGGTGANNWRSTPNVSVREGQDGAKSSLALYHGNGSQHGPYAYDPVSAPITMVITVTWTSGNNADVAFYCNGDHLLTLSAQYMPDYVDSIYFGRDVDVQEAVFYRGQLTEEEAMELSVPEPTTLAVLALGVAVLTLRRSAA